MHFTKLSAIIAIMTMLAVSVQANPIPDPDDTDYSSHDEPSKASKDSYDPHSSNSSLIEDLIKFEKWAVADEKFNDYITKAFEDFSNGDDVNAKLELVKAAVEIAFKYKGWSKLLSDGESWFAEHSVSFNQ